MDRRSVITRLGLGTPSVEIRGLLSFWDADNLASINKTGDVINSVSDLSGNGHNLTGQNSIKHLTDANGGYFHFDGAGYFDINTPIRPKVVLWFGKLRISGVEGIFSSEGTGSYVFMRNNTYAISMDGGVGDIGTWFLNGVNKGSGTDIGNSSDIPYDIDSSNAVRYESGDPLTNIDYIGQLSNGFRLHAHIRKVITSSAYLTDQEIIDIMNFYSV